jgi:hypothetical protein
VLYKSIWGAGVSEWIRCHSWSSLSVSVCSWLIVCVRDWFSSHFSGIGGAWKGHSNFIPLCVRDGAWPLILIGRKTGAHSSSGWPGKLLGGRGALIEAWAGWKVSPSVHFSESVGGCVVHR